VSLAHEFRRRNIRKQWILVQSQAHQFDLAIRVTRTV
jgi:hypothetical protein